MGCRSSDVVKLSGALSNEQALVEMPKTCHERIRAQLTERTTESNEQMNR